MVACKPFRHGVAAILLACAAGAWTPAVSQALDYRAPKPRPPPCRPALKGGSGLLRSHGRFVAPVRIDDYSAVLMLIDSGAQGTGLAPGALASLHLKEDPRRTDWSFGVDGRMKSHPSIASALTIGAVHWAGPLRIGPMNINRLEDDGDPAAPLGLVGADLMSAYDVELDFPAQTIAFYDSACGADVQPPWRGPVDAFAPGDGLPKLFTIPVTLDGHVVQAVVDTGATSTVISRDVAVALGVDPAVLAQDRAGSAIGLAGVPTVTHLHRFDTIKIGSATYANPLVAVQEHPFAGGFDMLLGMDFLRQRKLWLSYSTGRVFIQVLPTAITGAAARQPPPPG